MTAIISVKHPDPQFEGQTKGKLGNTDTRAVVSQVLGEKLEEYLLENPNEAKLILEKISLSSKARRAATLAREGVRRKDGIEFTTLPGKLADCSSRNPEESELFIVEGNSAGGSAKTVATVITSDLAVTRKILNVQKRKKQESMKTLKLGT